MAVDDAAFSSVDLVGQCLFDRDKAVAFRAALNARIRPEHVVLDLGSGSGILALLAADAGAKKVIAVELDPYVAAIAARNIRRNGYEGRIEIVVGDARTIRLKQSAPFDVVLCEMLTTGLVDEFQVQAINNLHAKGYVSPATVFLPERQATYVTLCQSDFQVHGFTMAMPLHLWGHSPNVEWHALSEPHLLSTIRFDGPIAELFADRVAIQPVRDGVANAVILSSRAWIDADHSLENTHSVNAPVLIPIASRRVQIDQPVATAVAYRFGQGYAGLEVTLI